MTQKKPLVFTMTRDYTMAEMGHLVIFRKDVPVAIPVLLHDHALAAGATASGELPPKGTPTGKSEPVDPALREQAVFEAFKMIVERGERTDFTAGRKPHTNAVEAITGWNLDARERDELWDKYRQTAG